MNARTSGRRWPRGRCTQGAHSGQALVEAAIAFPLLLLVALGLVQFALYVHAQHVVTGAVQDGARVAAAADGTPGLGYARARQLLDAGLGCDAAGVAVTAEGDANAVVVEARGSLKPIIPWIGDAGLPLQARAMTQKEAFRVGR